jgi:hypothetical protein
MAANFTTRNPIFVLSNFSRDYIFSSTILPVKENAKYALQFQKNIVLITKGLSKAIRGKADGSSNKYDQYAMEYILNGGKTGYSHITELNDVQKQIERDIKRHGKTDAFHAFTKAMGSMNDYVENLTRLAVYVTSREQGRDIKRSISDAKEITVNFNRTGSGGMGGAIFKSLYLFVNAGIQALFNFAKVAKANPKKISALIASYAFTGILPYILAALTGDDDGLEEYMKLSDFERQNFLCIYTGSGFVKIPLPMGLRSFHGLGDNIGRAMLGYITAEEAIKSSLLGFTDFIPANPTGAVKGSWADLTPDAMKPFTQILANKDFTGKPVYNEWENENKTGFENARRNKKGEPFAPEWLMKLSEMTSSDGVKPGWFDFNPDRANHIMRGYLGGLYTIASQSIDIASKSYDFTQTGEFNLKVRETPLRAFYTSQADLIERNSKLNSSYYEILKEVQKVSEWEKGYREQVGKGELPVLDYYKKIEELNYTEYNKMNQYIKLIKKYEDYLPEATEEEAKQIEDIVSLYKEEMINFYHQGIKKPD